MAFAIAAAFFLTRYSYASELKLDASMALREECNDNIFISETDPIDDIITTLSPQLDLVQKTERSNVELLGRLDGIYYAQNDELNDIDQEFKTLVNHWFNPRFKLDGEFRYNKDSRPDRDIETTGLLLSTFNRYRRYFILSGEYSISEKTASILTYSFINQNFENPELTDFDSHAANLTLIRRMATYFPSTSARFIFGYNQYDYPEIEVNNYSGTLGVYHEITEKLNFSLDLGGRVTRQRSQNETLMTSSFLNESESGFTGKLLFSYEGESSKENLTLSHDIKSASGRNALTERTALVFDISHRFSDIVKGLVKVGYYLNTADQGTFATEDIDVRTLRFQLGVHFDISDDLVMDSSYIYTRSRDEVEKETAKSNLISIQLALEYPFLE